MSTLTASPAMVLRKMLQDAGKVTAPTSNLAWPGYYSDEPPKPDNLVVVFDTAGRVQSREMVSGQIVESYGVQLLIRAVDHSTGWAKANDIRTWMAESVVQEAVEVDGDYYTVAAISKFGSVLTLGNESPTSKRKVFTLNAMMSITQEE